MKRFFAFGCSFTYYSWPTWADFIGTQFDEYYNLGMPGCGNEFIEQMVHEADFWHQLGPEDTVIVMLTGYSRNDSFVEGQWIGRGNVYADANHEVYPDRWFQTHWSLEQGILTTWRAERNIRQLLTAKGCKFRILAAIPILENGQTNSLDSSAIPAHLSQQLKEISQDYDRNTEPKGGQYLSDFLKTREDFYYADGAGFDKHPTVIMHASYVQSEFPEFFTPEMNDLATRWHVMISKRSGEENV